MTKSTFLIDNKAFETKFRECCREYDHLDMFVAWVGNSHHVIPFVHLGMLSKINAVVGVSFCQTHPNGLQFLIDAGVDLRIAKIGAGKKEVLFHPKVYVFSSNQKRAVFMGSSNFTLNGFHKNFESNVLIEGLASDSEIAGVEKELSKWRNEEYSFLPGEIWLKGYEDRYNKRRQKIKEAGLDDEADVEEQSSGAATWLAIAHWDVYLKEVRKGLQVDSAVNNESLQQRISLFKRFEKDLALPWEIDYFSDIEKRRLIGGMGQYGWLGHVGASGDFRRMLANGTNKEHRTIIATINEIAALSLPIEWLLLSALLYKLTALCPTMKVWGRLLAIVRPDIYCTISAPHVRKNIAVEIGQPERFLEGVEGYIMLLQLVHSSPWFQSDPPVKRSELDIWKRRVAFLDVVFYNF